MNATPPEAKPEDSRGPRLSQAAPTISRTVLTGGVIGGLLLIAAEFTPLYREESAAARIPLHTIRAGSHHGYALIPVGLLALVLAVGFARGWRAGAAGGRTALVALGALGVAAALVAVLGDLPDAQASGFARVATLGFVKAKDVPAIGLYLETLGAALLVITAGAGLLLTSPGSARSARSPQVGTGLSAP
jgi:hypothetical protein